MADEVPREFLPFLLPIAEHAWNDSGCDIYHEHEGNEVKSYLSCEENLFPILVSKWRSAGPDKNQEASALYRVILRRVQRNRKYLPSELGLRAPTMDELVEGSFLGMDPVDVSRCKAPDVPQLHAFERCLADVGEVSAKHMWDDSCRNESMAVTHALNQQADLFGSVVGWSEADQGVHRRTHKLGKACVLKLAVSASGASANKAEYGSWRAILATENPDFVKLFVPTRKIGPQGAYIVSKRVTPLDVFVKQNAMTHREADRYVIQMEEALDRAGASCSDLKSDNVGIDEDGQPRILDYGFGVRCPVNPNPEGRPRPPPGQPVRPAADSRVLFHCRRRVTNRPFSSLPL